MPEDGPARVSIEVVAAVIADPHGRILIQRRHHGTHDGGLWEFPGGKIEPRETAMAALIRELREELGIDVVAAQPLMRVDHDHHDGHRRITLDTWRVTEFEGDVEPREGQPLRWVHVQHLAAHHMPAADRPIAEQLSSPESGSGDGTGSAR